MRIAIVSDIHSNYIALEAVLDDAGQFDRLWNLGDTIGYGPRPNECMARVHPISDVMIAGNHDLACIGKVNLDDFNADARTANLWNGRQLQQEYRTILETLPPRFEVDERFLVVHGSPREPIWEYLLSTAQARENFGLFRNQVCFIGHSHVPLVFTALGDGGYGDPLLPQHGAVLELKPDNRYFVNPGSVGQPRNHDPRAAYALLDTDGGTIAFRRVAYDIATTQRQMQEAGLPAALIRRLSYGM